MAFQAMQATIAPVAEPELFDPSDDAELKRMVAEGRLTAVEESALYDAQQNFRTEQFGFGG